MTRVNVRKALLVAVGAVFVLAPGTAAAHKESGGARVRDAKIAALAKERQSLNYDVRVTDRAALTNLLPPASLTAPNSGVRKSAAEQARNIQAGLASLRAEVPSAAVTISELTGALEVLSSKHALTAPSSDSGTEIVRRFITKNRVLYGLGDRDIADLKFAGESVSAVSGLRLVIVKQVVNGREVFQSDTRFLLDRTGRIVKSLGLFVPNAAANAAGLGNLISPQEALSQTMASVGISVDVNAMTLSNSEPGGLKTEISVESPDISGKVTSEVVYFPIAPGVVVPAWSQIIFGRDADWYALADASNGALLWRKNIRSDASTHEARFRVYVQADGVTPADSPAPQSPSTAAPGAGTQYPEIPPTIVNMLTAQNVAASPNGWIDDCPGGGCTANETQTLGNNALACLDVVVGGNTNVCDTAAGSVLDGNGRPTGNADAFTRDRDFLGTAARDFESLYLPPPQGGNPEAGQAPTPDSFRRGAVTQLFYVTNWYHDRLYTYGFTPAAGNFQTNNFGGGGVGNDRVLGDAQDGSSTNNANFSTPPDGASGRAQMFKFTGPTIDRDGDLDSEVLVHELTHGTSNRLIGNATGLVWSPGRGLGEGWSDFVALSLLNNTNADTPGGNYASGAYATYKAFGVVTYTDNYVYGIRRFPYSTNNSVNPLTWADVDDVTNNLSGGIAPDPLGFNGNGALEVHNVGEVWANTLWEVRSRVIADPAGANGDVPTGNSTMLALVIDGMKMTPLNPSFIDGRNAIIDADCAANACANEESIWAGFADRGLGYGAIAPLGRIFGYRAGHMGVGESFASPNLDVNTVTVDDFAGNNSGNLDPGETANLKINVKNPWRRATKSVPSATATLTSSTAGVTITNGSTSYPAIAADGNADPTGTPLSLTVAGTATCGSSIALTLTITSTLGTVARDFTLRLGTPSGTDPVVTYTRDPSPDIAIPDNAPRGVGDSMTITDDFEIADLNFRVDSLTHPFEGDLTLMLKGPNGYGTDLITAIGGASDGGPGDNLVDTVIDDTAAAPNDLLSVTTGSAPMTGDWLPIFNAPSWTGVGFPTDPVGQLGRFNGQSTKGTWNLRVSDQALVDSGTLNAWSLLVTPRAFTCSPPTAVAVATFGAKRAGSAVRVSWRTGSEARIAGFNVFRNGVKLNRTLIAAKRAGTASGGAYRFVDRAALRSHRHTYRLQILDLKGNRGWYGALAVSR